MWKTSRAGGGGEARRSWARGAGLWDRRLGSCGWGSCGWGLGFCGRWPAVGTWRVGDRRLGFCGSGSLRHVDRRFAVWGWGLGACRLRFGAGVCDPGLALAAWGWGVIRATGVWAPGRSLGRAEVYGFAWGLRFGRRDVACCLQFGPESGLGFRIWEVGAGGAGGLPFAVLAGVWGLRLGFAARGLQLAVWRLRFGDGDWGSQFGEDGSLRFCPGSAVWTP